MGIRAAAPEAEAMNVPPAVVGIVYSVAKVTMTWGMARAAVALRARRRRWVVGDMMEGFVVDWMRLARCFEMFAVVRGEDGCSEGTIYTIL
jgi:hypothetical protein